ncbi:hypothetical protein Mapa_016234 [Marchantia paleacea]|nr:hypothetical protein Mapa_016234 [Marchantia paleacea]
MSLTDTSSLTKAGHRKHYDITIYFQYLAITTRLREVYFCGCIIYGAVKLNAIINKSWR